MFTNNITLASSPLYNASDVSGVGNTGVYSVPFSFRIKVIGLWYQVIGRLGRCTDSSRVRQLSVCSVYCLVIELCFNYFLCQLTQGRNHRWKVEGDQGLGPNTGALASRARPEAGLGVGAVGGRPLPLWGSGVLPRKIFENSDAKSCILVASALISGLPRTCISEQTTSMSRAKSVPKFQLFSRGCAPGC